VTPVHTMTARPAPRVTRTYRALKGLCRIVVSVFYRRVDVTGDGAWRAAGRPTIVVANHTNALADPVVILAKLPGHPRFLAAGSWWKFAPARWLFRLAGVVPVYRRGDGGGVNANKAAFAACHEALAEGATLAVFPEGALHHEPSIAPLKTGAARIALGAAADAGVADVVVLPVGIVYEDRGRFRSQSAVQVGTPLPVAPWVERYRTDPRAAARALTEAVARGLRAVTVNHESWADLRLVDRAAAVALAEDRSIDRRYARRNELRRGLGAALTHSGGRDDPAWADLAARVATHQHEVDALGLDMARPLPDAARLARERTRLRWALGALAPAAALGAVANAPVALTMKGVTAAVKDPAWQATSKGLAGVLLCPIVWGTEAYLVRRHGRRAMLAVAVTAPLGGLAWIGWRECRARWRQMRAEGALLADRGEELRTAAETRAAVRGGVHHLIAADRDPGRDVTADVATVQPSASTT
jgi:glycerol-3-phosphate O-acyltransferase/dihydroxyacetone phosphate acyltransferase